MSQATDILNYIDKHGSITDAEAAEHFQCYRLSGRIYDLRKLGVDIITDKVKGRNGCLYAKYRRG